MKSGIKMPKIIYGTAWKKVKTASLVYKAIKLGFRGIDTACQPRHYFEPGVGEALNKLEKEGISRDQIFLQTKFTPISGQDPDTIPYNPKSSLQEQVWKSFLSSQKNLGTDYLDSLILHSMLDTHDETIEAWGGMEDIHSNSGAKQLGISNCYDLEKLKKLYDDARVKPSVLQNRFYKTTDFDKEIRKWCFENDIIYQSFWTLTANRDFLQSPLIEAIALSNNKTPAQILFRYLTQIGVAPLTGTTSDAHMKEDLAIFEFVLLESDIERINNLL
tara:strand:+ start:76071 stop:76892 length:822 start_codon:yes stop_codon:yes gene_type:complete